MNSHQKHRFQGHVPNWLRLLLDMKLITRQDADEALERAAAGNPLGQEPDGN
jgi:hypothetical protein